MKTPQEQLQALDWFISNIQMNYSKHLQMLQAYEIDTSPLMYNNIKIEREIDTLRNILIHKINAEANKK